MMHVGFASGIIGLTIVAVLLVVVFFPAARLRRRRRKTHGRIISTSRRPSVRFSVKPPKE